jgi:hypothetical protein
MMFSFYKTAATTKVAASAARTVQSTAPRPLTGVDAANAGNITPFHHTKADDVDVDVDVDVQVQVAENSEDAFPWVVVAKKFTAAIVDSWAASSPSEDDLDAVAAQAIIDAMEAELELQLELSPSSKRQKESVYGMLADWDAYN